MTKATDFFSIDQQNLISKAIEQAELNTSGEIRVHIENECKEDVLDKAADIFAILEIHKTKLRNGVLFYIAIDDKKFAVLGDAGINSKVPDGFWDEVKNTLLENFKNKLFTEGLCMAIRMAGEKLKEHFPYQSDDENELSNDLSFGKN